MGQARQRKLQAEKERAAQQQAAALGLWPLGDAARQAQIESWFVQRGIDPSRPGVHDTPAFLRAEAQDRRAMDLVARLVEARVYSAEELATAGRKIMVAAQAVERQVALDGRKGLCVIASGILSRMLDELGVWNYVAKANAAVHFPPDVSDEPQHFYAIDFRPVTAPHAIVVAPPFTAIDVTLKHQPYESAAMADWIPSIVATKEMRLHQVVHEDLFAREALAIMRQVGDTPERFIARDRAAMRELMTQIPAREVPLQGGHADYVIVAVGGYQESLRDLDMNANLNGRHPLEIFEKNVLPLL